MASVPAFGCFDCWLSEVASIRHCDTNQKEHLDADGLFDAAHEFIRVATSMTYGLVVKVRWVR